MCRKYFFILVLSCLTATIVDAKQRSKKTRQSRQATASRPIELRGSKEQRIQQNIKAINLGIHQIMSGQELLNLEGNNILIKLVDMEYYIVNRGGVQVSRKSRWGRNRIPCSPQEAKILVRRYVKSYIDLFAHDFFLEFRKKIKLTSGARSFEEHVLMRTKGSCTYNPNAAIANNPLEESLHVRALAIDISRRVIVVSNGKSKEVAMSHKEIDWMRKRLIADKLKGVEFLEKENNDDYDEIETEPIEENICYHIVVFPQIVKPVR